MHNLRKILNESKMYKSEQQNRDLIKLMAVRGCFSKQAIVAIKENTNPSQKKQQERAERALKVWPDGIDYPASQNLTDEQADLFLDNIQFPTKESAANWLIEVTSVRMLRDTFDKEGHEVDKKGESHVNLKRWDLSDAIDITSIQEPETIEYKILALAKSLELIDEFKLPSPGVCNHILIQGGLQGDLKKDEGGVEVRIAFIVKYLTKYLENTPNYDFVIFMHYLTSPRYLFNNEKSLAEILASERFLNVPDKVEIIRKILLESKENWLNGLPILKEKILSAVGVKTWPETVDSWYNLDKDVYKKLAKEKGLDSLEGWPVAMDMVEFLFEKHAESNPTLKAALKNGNIVLRAAPACGQPNKIATTEDVVQAWYEKYGKEIISTAKEKELMVASVVDNITHDIIRQSQITRTVLQKNNSKFIVVPCGPAAKKLSFVAICDALTKYCFHVMEPFVRKKAVELDKKTEAVSTFINPKRDSLTVTSTLSEVDQMRSISVKPLVDFGLYCKKISNEPQFTTYRSYPGIQSKK